jgi:carbon monoxide dehydrogenase subunit G
MASIRKERTIEAAPEAVWDALRDWGALHERLVPGFVVDTRLDGGDRVVTFFNDAVARERLVDLSDQERRLVWSIVDGPYTHHNGAAQVIEDGEGATRFVWVADLLPDELAGVTGELMERGIETVKRTLEAGGPAG